MKTILQHSVFAVSFVLLTFGNITNTRAQIQVEADGVGAYKIYNLAKVGNKLFYYGFNETTPTNLDLYTYDGTTSTMVKHLSTITQQPSIFGKYFHDGYGKAYFHFGSTGTSLADGLEVSDGTEAGTINLIDCAQPDWLVNCNGKVFFSTKVVTVDDKELYVTDGTKAGTKLVKDIYPGLNGSNPQNAVAFKNELWFRAKSSVSGSFELYKSDGTEAGTQQFVYPSTLSSNVAGLYVDGDYLYFNGLTTSNKMALWRTDGTTAGTVMVCEGTNEVTALVIFNSIGTKILATATNLHTYASYMYTIDKVTLDTALLKSNFNIAPFQAGYGWPLNNKLIFLGHNTEAGDEPWITDGTPAGTFMLADITPGTAGTNIYRSVGFINNELYLNTDKNKIWKTDGTPAGTIGTGVENDNTTLNCFASLDNVLYFIKDSKDRERKLFKYGTSTGIQSTNLTQNNITVYPNPTNGIINISNQNNQAVSLTIYNLMGKLVYQNKSIVNDVKIDLKEYSKGLYFLNFDTGHEIITKKIIIE